MAAAEPAPVRGWKLPLTDAVLHFRTADAVSAFAVRTRRKLMKRKLARVAVLLPGLLGLLAGGRPAGADCVDWGASPRSVNCGPGCQFSWAACNSGIHVKTYDENALANDIGVACNSCTCGDNTCFKNAMIQGGHFICGTCP
jgi:hypothetical protein